jgi:predicted LPLAT superfamily acyltransferase
MNSVAESAPTTWLSQRERGSVWLMAGSFRLATFVGRRAMRPIVQLVALWYTLFDRSAVRASREWWRIVHGRPARLAEVHRHFATFAQVTLDRMFLLRGATRGLRFTRTGADLLAAQKQSGRGAVLLGAHLGSYEALRAGGDQDRFAIQIVGHFANARHINALLERVDPKGGARVIHLGDDPVGTMGRVRARLEAGDFVALLGDRTGLSERSIRVPFFGRTAAFATGPFLVAHLLRCPVYLVFGLYRAPDRYDLVCERFAEAIDLPRKGRDEALARYVALYAERLEHHARTAPDNWFNFFDFFRAE